MIAPITRIGRNSSASDICCAFGSVRRTAGHCRQSSLTDTAAMRSETEGVSCCRVFRWSRRWKLAEGARPGGVFPQANPRVRPERLDDVRADDFLVHEVRFAQGAVRPSLSTQCGKANVLGASENGR